MPKRRHYKKYVLFGCPVAASKRYDVKGYIGKTDEGIDLVPELSDAIIYTDNKKQGHGAPADWIKMFKDEYGYNVNPVFLYNEKRE